VADAVGERAADDGEDAGDGFEAAVEVGENLGAAAGGLALVADEFAEIDVELGGGNGDDVVAAFGATEAAADLADLGDGEDLGLDDIGDFVHLLERSAGRRSDGDEGGFLAEGREKIFAHAAVEGKRGDDAGKDEEGDGKRVVEAGADGGAAENGFEEADESAVGVWLADFGVEQERAEDRDQRQGDDERGDHAEDRRDGDGGKEPALDAAETEEREEDEDDFEEAVYTFKDRVLLMECTFDAKTKKWVPGRAVSPRTRLTPIYNL
jgi:hypothetical protein